MNATIDTSNTESSNPLPKRGCHFKTAKITLII